MGNPTINKHEDALIARLYATEPKKIMRITRRSPRPYDLTIEGFYTDQSPVPGVNFSAWLPLAAIHALPAKDYARAVKLSDYPEMGGDWSGIRDSAPETIWRMFTVLVLGEGGRKRDYASTPR